MFLIVPLSAILIVLRIPVVRLVFGASTLFDWQSTVLTGHTLAFFSLSLFAQSLAHLLARSFYALQDSKTPVIIGAVSVITNTILSLLFVLVFKLDVWVLALSASIASILNMLLLLLMLYKKIGNITPGEIILPSVKIFLASFVAAVALYIPIKLLDQLVFVTTRTINLLILTGFSVGLGLFVYLFFAWFMDVKEINIIFKLITKLTKPKPPIAIDTAPEVVNI